MSKGESTRAAPSQPPMAKMQEALSEFSPPWDEVLELIVAHGKEVADVVAGPDKDCALHSASYWGENAVVAALLDVGADVNTINRRKETPLHLAAMNGRVETVKLLMRRGADWSVRDEEGNQPLHRACCAGDEKMVAVLIDMGASILGRNSVNGNTACHVSAREGHPSICRLLCSRGDSEKVLGALNDAKEQPLHRAAAHGQRDVVAALVKLGADMNAVDANCDRPLHLAAMFGMSETASELVSLGADIDAVDEDCQTPLHLACAFKQEEAACALLKLGAASDIKNDEGNTPRQLAAHNGLMEVISTIEAVKTT